MRFGEIEETKRDVRYSLLEQLGLLGGGSGLFTGLSIMSLVEVLFWMARALVIVVKRKD